MSRYSAFIKAATLIDRIDSVTTTGDPDYEGTALEINDLQGNELFHVIVDERGNQQFLFFRAEGHYRMPVELVERIIEAAKLHVKRIE